MRKPDGMAEPSEYVAQRLRERLAADGRVNALGIEVAVRGDEVVLTGAVASEGRREAVERVASEELPGHVIVNHLTVLDLADAHGREDVP